MPDSALCQTIQLKNRRLWTVDEWVEISGGTRTYELVQAVCHYTVPPSLEKNHAELYELYKEFDRITVALAIIRMTNYTPAADRVLLHRLFYIREDYSKFYSLSFNAPLLQDHDIRIRRCITNISKFPNLQATLRDVVQRRLRQHAAKP